MKISKSKYWTEKYTASIVEIKEKREIKDAKNVELIIVNNFNLVTKKGLFNIGDVVVYCSNGTKINHDFLYVNSLFNKKELNKDNIKNGFFNQSRIINPVHFMGIVSCGILFTAKQISNFINENEDDVTAFLKRNIGFDFDTINNKLFVEKYNLDKIDFELVQDYEYLNSDIVLPLEKHIYDIDINNPIYIYKKAKGIKCVFSKQDTSIFRHVNCTSIIKILDKLKLLRYKTIYSFGDSKRQYIFGIEDTNNNVIYKFASKINKLLPKNSTLYGNILAPNNLFVDRTLVINKIVVNGINLSVDESNVFVRNNLSQRDITFNMPIERFNLSMFYGHNDFFKHLKHRYAEQLQIFKDQNNDIIVKNNDKDSNIAYCLDNYLSLINKSKKNK